MARRRETLNKYHFTITILQIIFLIGFCTGSEDVGKNVDTTEFKGSSEKKVFNFEPDRQSPAGSQNSEEVEKKKNLSGTHQDDEYVVQEDDVESDGDNYIVQEEDEVFEPDDDDGYIVQADDSPSDDDFPPNLEPKNTFASSPNVNTPNEDQVLQTKELYDDAIPTGRKDVYHYGNASPQKQEKQAQGSESNDGSQKTKLSTWEKAQLMMVKRNKNKLEKEAKLTEASKRDQIDSNLMTSEGSFNIETLENSPSQILSNKSTVETSDDPVTSIDTGVNLPGLIDDDQTENKVDSDDSKDSVPKIDINKNGDKITNDKLTDYVNDKVEDDHERIDFTEDSDKDTSLTNVQDELHTSTNNVTVEDLKIHLKGVDMKTNDAKKEVLQQMDQEIMESGSQIEEDESHKDFKSDSEGNDVAFEEEKDIDKDNNNDNGDDEKVKSDIKDNVMPVDESERINVMDTKSDVKNDDGAKNVADPIKDINHLTDDINEDEVKEINITTHDVTSDPMEHIYPDDEDIEEAFMDHVYPDNDDDDGEKVVNSEKKSDIDEDGDLEETSYDDEAEDDEESDDTNQYEVGNDDDDAIVNDDISKDKEGVVIVDKNQTDSLTDVTANNLAGLIDKIDTYQPQDIMDPEEEESIMNDEYVFEKVFDTIGKITKSDDDEVKKKISTEMGQEVENDDEESFNVTIVMAIGDRSEKEDKETVDDIVSDIGVDDVKGIHDDINKHVDDDDDDQDDENKVEQDERTKKDKSVITTFESNNENDAKNISINLEADINNITDIIDGDNNNNNISHDEIISNEIDNISANESTVESFEDNAKEKDGITDNRIEGIDNNETSKVVENVEPTENKNDDVITEEIDNKTVDIVVETDNKVIDVETTLSKVDNNDQIEISDNQKEVKNDDDDDVIKKEFNNETDKGITEDNTAKEYEATDNDGEASIDKRNETESLEFQDAKDNANYTTGEIDNIVGDKLVDEISMPNTTFEDTSAHVELIDDDGDDDDDDESGEIDEETSGEDIDDDIGGDDIDDDIGGDDIVEEENKIQTNLTDADAIVDEQIFINNSLSDHPIAIDSTVDSSHKHDGVPSETSKIERPIDEINGDSNSIRDGLNDKHSTTSLEDETARLPDVSDSVEESFESHKEESDIKVDNTFQVDEHFEEVIDNKSEHGEAGDVQSVEDSKNDDKSDVINSKPEDEMNSNIESAGPTNVQTSTSGVDPTDVKEEELSDEKPIELKDFLSQVEKHDEHPQTTHEDEGQSNESVDDGALTHEDDDEANEEVDTGTDVVTEDKKILDEGLNEEDKYIDTEEIGEEDERLVVEEVEQIFQEMFNEPTNSFWWLITLEPYITLLNTLLNMLDSLIISIISMLPPSVQVIFLRAPFGMYPSHAFLVFIFLSFFSSYLFITQIYRMSQVDRQNKTRPLRDELFEKRGEVLLKQLEKDEADKTLKEVREELAQKEKALENRRAKKDEDLKAIIKDHDALKDEILKKSKKYKDMESEAEKIASDVAKQSLVTKELQESISTTKEQIQLLQEKRDELQYSIDKSELNSLQLEVNIRRLNDDVGVIKESYDQMSTEVESKKKESEELRSTVDALNVKCSKQSNDIQSKEQDNKALRNAILQLKIMQLLLKENGDQCGDDDDHNDEADGDDDDDDDQKKQAKIDEKIKHLVYIAQMKCRMDEIEKERLSLRKHLSKEADVRINLNDDLSRTTEEIKKYEQMKENEEQQATKQKIRISVWEQDLKNKESEYTRISLEMKEKERAKSKQKKSAEEKCKEVEKMVADNSELVEQLKAEKKKMWSNYEKQIALQENRVQENQSFAREADREYESKRNLSQILGQKLLIFRDKIHMLESMSSMQKSSESLNASCGKEDERSSSRNLLLREDARPSISPLPPPHLLPEFLRFPPLLPPPPPILFDRVMHPSHLMRPRESSPIPDGFRDEDDRHRFHQMRNTPPQRIAPLPPHRYSPPLPRDKYPSGNNRPQQYMGKGDGSHRASHN